LVSVNGMQRAVTIAAKDRCAILSDILPRARSEAGTGDTNLGLQHPSVCSREFPRHNQIEALRSGRDLIQFDFASAILLAAQSDESFAVEFGGIVDPRRKRWPKSAYMRG